MQLATSMMQPDACSFGVASEMPYKFTGKERDAETCNPPCLDYFGARHYGSSLGRFRNHSTCTATLGVFVLGLIMAIPRDRARVRMLEHGRRLRGPQMVTVKEFNPVERRERHRLQDHEAKTNDLDSARARE